MDVSTVFNNEDEVSSNSEEFYKNYWTQGDDISEMTQWKNKEILDKFFPEGIVNKKILEIGVGGEGGLIRNLKNNNHVEGIDISDSAILNCRKFGLTLQKANLDIDSLPYNPGSFDIIFAFEVFEHFANPQHAIEELRKVLKSGGVLIVSIPTPLTYHWPRLFYPSLFEFDNFKEFLMINSFNAEYVDLKLFANIQNAKNINERSKMLSWFWKAEKIKDNDSEAFLRIGTYFWEQKNEDNLRLKPVEAIEMLRKSYGCDVNNIKTKLFFLKALIYRLSLKDEAEFNELYSSLNQDINKPEFQSNPEFLYELLLIDLEAKSLSQPGYNKDFLDTVKNILMNLPGGKNILERYSIKLSEMERCNLLKHMP